MSIENIERAIRDRANEIGLALLTRKLICELAGVKVGSYGTIMNESFATTLDRMEDQGLPRFVQGVDITNQPRRTTPEVRKALILEAALRLCRRTLWARLTRAEIATEAGVSPSLIPYYFGTMKQLRDSMEFEAKRHGIPLIPRKAGV